jgi:hypothetical protein
MLTPERRGVSASSTARALLLPTHCARSSAFCSVARLQLWPASVMLEEFLLWIEWMSADLQ